MIASLGFALAALVAAVQAQSDLHINTPSQVRTCIPVALTWTGGASPYYLQVLQGGSTTDALSDLGEQTSTSYTWTPSGDDFAVGTSITFGLTDSNGNTAYTDNISVTQGSSSCAAASASADGSDASTTAAAAAAGSSSSETTSAKNNTATKSSNTAAAAKSNSASSEDDGTNVQPSTDDSSASALKISALAGVAAVVAFAL